MNWGIFLVLNYEFVHILCMFLFNNFLHLWSSLWKCFYQSTLRISPPLPYLASNMQKDLLRLGSRLDPQDSSSPMTPPSSASPTSSAISRRWRTSSPWPGASMLDQSDDAFSIEREARLHRQAAGKTEILMFFIYCFSLFCACRYFFLALMMLSVDSSDLWI